MCRQYNNYGSIARDAVDGNLNSVNFPKFEENAKDTTDKDMRSQTARESLL